MEALNKIAVVIGIKDKKPSPRIDSAKKVVLPVVKSTHNLFARLRLSSNSNGFTPILSKTNKADSLTMDYKIINSGTGEAFNLKMFTILSAVVNGKIIATSKKTTNSYDSSVSIYPNKTDGQLATTLIMLPQIAIDSTFICLKIDFADSTKNRKAFMKIYQINHDPLYLKEVQDTLSERIRNFLLKNKYWKPPFRQ